MKASKLKNTLFSLFCAGAVLMTSVAGARTTQCDGSLYHLHIYAPSISEVHSFNALKNNSLGNAAFAHAGTIKTTRGKLAKYEVVLPMIDGNSFQLNLILNAYSGSNRTLIPATPEHQIRH